MEMQADRQILGSSSTVEGAVHRETVMHNEYNPCRHCAIEINFFFFLMQMVFKNYLFIYWLCAGVLLLPCAFAGCSEWGLLSSFGARASHQSVGSGVQGFGIAGYNMWAH